MSRPFDVVVHGATGFTGRQAAAYLAANAPPAVRWAVSGRDRVRLGAIVDGLRAAPNPPGAALHADATDPPTCGAMARDARVVLTTAGPYARLGDPIVAACVAEGADYVDITGETPWVRRVIDRHHEAARARGLRIVPCCGFDSVPSDLGARLVVLRLRALGQAPASVRGYFSARGGLNGGTLASAVGLSAGDDARAFADPVLLNPPGWRTDAERARAGRDRTGPAFDPVRGAWSAPFFMAGVNTRVVRRSAALLAEVGHGYGPRFTYDEGLDLGPRGGRVAATAVALGLRVADGALRTRLGRALAGRLGPRPGEGPSEAVMDGGWFKVDLVGEGEGGRVVRATVSGEGDPGNRCTVRILCEAALALVLDRARLDALGPADGVLGGGVLTPATAFGPVLLERLVARGMRFSADGA